MNIRRDQVPFRFPPPERLPRATFNAWRVLKPLAFVCGALGVLAHFGIAP